MSIKRKRPGAAPDYPHQWQRVATTLMRKEEARRLYREQHPTATLIEAHRAVADFYRHHAKTYGHG